MALVKYNDRSLRNLTTAPAAATSSPGALVHIKTLTASSSSTLSFVDGTDSVVLDNTYPIYKFEFINIHPSADDGGLVVNFSVDTGSNYNVAKTSTNFEAYHNEAGDDASLNYSTSGDLAQGTGVQHLTGISSKMGYDNDQSASGELFLFNPSSTTFVKHFISEFNQSDYRNYTWKRHVAGYCNTTSAVDAAQFSMSSGNIDAGQIKLYGIKDA
jgi:hypothetical protein